MHDKVTILLRHAEKLLTCMMLTLNFFNDYYAKLCLQSDRLNLICLVVITIGRILPTHVGSRDFIFHSITSITLCFYTHHHIIRVTLLETCG